MQKTSQVPHPPQYLAPPSVHVTTQCVPFAEENKKHVAMETVREFDWCLEQLETMHSSKSVGGLAQAKVGCVSYHLCYIMSHDQCHHNPTPLHMDPLTWG